jgi:hypothetical protein
LTYHNSKARVVNLRDMLKCHIDNPLC